MSKLITIEDGYEIRLGQKNPSCYPCCFEEFGMPDKHVVGRMVLPKRAYRVIKIDERRGQYLSGKDLEEGKARKFHIEQIIEVL